MTHGHEEGWRTATSLWMNLNHLLQNKRNLGLDFYFDLHTRDWGGLMMMTKACIFW